MNLWTRLNTAPHKDVKIHSHKDIDFHGAFIATWTDNYDSDNETEYWYCIKDDLFDLSAIKAKRRYEINKGNKNFTTKVIDPTKYFSELYEVYVGSLKGYTHSQTPCSEDEFRQRIEAWSKPECCFFGVFDNNRGKLCGYADVYIRTPYLPISSLKTIPEFEREGVNFALIYGIYKHFEEEIKKGAYLCDGARNSLHQTHFQDFLIKYFGFRRAYCNLHLAYRWYLKPVISILFPIRYVFRNNFLQLYALLKMEAWSRGIKEE